MHHLIIQNWYKSGYPERCLVLYGLVGLVFEDYHGVMCHARVSKFVVLVSAPYQCCGTGLSLLGYKFVLIWSLNFEASARGIFSRSSVGIFSGLCGFSEWIKLQIHVISALSKSTAGLSLHTAWHTTCTHVQSTNPCCVVHGVHKLCLGYVRMYVGDSSECSGDCVKNIKLNFFFVYHHHCHHQHHHRYNFLLV